jgi:prepilin-type N-terminal cleavage/methylation domain-containing protein
MKLAELTEARSEKGFTVIEMIAVVAIMLVLAAMALPSYVQWRENLDARTTARQLSEMLRQAKSNAITTNFEQQVQFDTINRRYGMRSSMTSIVPRVGTSRNTTWAVVPAITNWTTYPQSVTVTPAGVTSIQFTPDGASNFAGVSPIMINILNTRATMTFSVGVTTSGRVSIGN